jgi:hypothetical protein
MATTSYCALCHAPAEAFVAQMQHCNIMSKWTLTDENLVEHMLLKECGNAKELLFFSTETLSIEDFF